MTIRKPSSRPASGSSRIRRIEQWAAVALAMATVASIGGFVVALAGGFVGWAVVAALVVIVVLVACILAARAGHRRRLAEPRGGVYSPDSPTDSDDYR
ncbi:hypothetical protein [Rhodococcus sp. ADH]|uniref:hypothetical protein n=1 Tax=Rhodococcus sp. ADH TaxID=224843 RepID=UPI0012EE48E1|nr:hypothetical protein [Rhodococcus sp. ADH]